MGTRLDVMIFPSDPVIPTRSPPGPDTLCTTELFLFQMPRSSGGDLRFGQWALVYKPNAIAWNCGHSVEPQLFLLGWCLEFLLGPSLLSTSINSLQAPQQTCSQQTQVSNYIKLFLCDLYWIYHICTTRISMLKFGFQHGRLPGHPASKGWCIILPIKLQLTPRLKDYDLQGLALPGGAIILDLLWSLTESDRHVHQFFTYLHR